ncbi:3014_t:CDS:1 [Acaulospora colombiana]|uniref:3014_t:CDS:1 n=1 Tax=Acaulospora colombiana TaxID=27376 RepID=A0ACA9LMW7_9GLOM|nr:3014_t:CDS:1 [Acaulospora colombiana]
MTRLTANPLPVDPTSRKATAVNLFSASRPYMRGLHFSWISFLTAFTGWFSVSPLLPSITKDLNLTPAQVGDGNIASVSSTIVFRVFIGLMCDRLGPKRVMASVLILGAIPTALAGLVRNNTDLVIVRFFIGILGASFVPCQFWTTQLFNSNAVGVANAIAAGWGNMGGGLTYLLMPLIFDLINRYYPYNVAWRLAMIFPAFLCIIVGVIIVYFSDDCPEGDWSNRGLPTLLIDEAEEDEKISRISVATERRTAVKVHKIPTAFHYLLVLINPNVILMMIMYGCSFGVEVAVDNVIGGFFYSRFGLSQTLSGLIGSIFGLLNIFSRASGGLTSDYLNRRLGVRGRLFCQFFFFFFQGAAFILFRFTSGTLSGAIVTMILISYFTEVINQLLLHLTAMGINDNLFLSFALQMQVCCGTSFAIVPYLDPAAVGIVSGLVGSGGNMGGLVFAAIFKAFSSDILNGFLVIGVIVIASSFLPFLMSINGRTLIFGNLKRNF